MADETTIANTDEDQDSDIVENLNDLFEESENVTESKCSYQSGIKTRTDLIGQFRSTKLNRFDIFERIYQTESSHVKLSYFPRLNTMNTRRKEEKESLTLLNDNLAKYLQAIRLLEIENRKLIILIKIFENSIKQKSSSTENIYQIEISQANEVLQQLQNQTPFHIKQILSNIESGEIFSEGLSKLHQINQEQIDSIRKTISSTDSEIILFRRRLVDIEDEIYRYQIESLRIISIMKDVRRNIETEIILKTHFQTDKLALEDQIDSTLSTHETEITELRSKYVSIDTDPSIIFRNELSQSIQQMRESHEQFIANEKNSLHNQYLISFNQFLIQKQQFQFDLIQINKDRERFNKLHQQILHSENQNIHLKAKNEHLNYQINHFQTLTQNLQQKNDQKTNEQLREIQQMRENLAQLNFNYNEITTTRISLEREINTYGELLQGRHGLQFHIDRILRGINTNAGTTYLKTISKKNLPFKNLKGQMITVFGTGSPTTKFYQSELKRKRMLGEVLQIWNLLSIDLKNVIFVDGSGSTSDRLKWAEKSILEVELNLCQMIDFADIVIWSTDASICEDTSIIEPNGITNPSSIFQNPSTKDLFQQSDVIFFLTDGQIEHQHVSQFSSHVKNDLNKALIVCIIIDENVEDRSLLNVSVVAPLIFAPNVLCLLYDGQTFSVILSKGSIRSFDSTLESSIDFKEFLNKVQLNEKILIPNDMLILNDNLNELVYFDFQKFLHLNDLDQMILIERHEWKMIIQYAKINNQLDQLKYFVSTMKIYSNYSDFNRILKQFDLHYLKKEQNLQNRIFLLKENSSGENNQQISKLENEMRILYHQMKEGKTNYTKENLHLTPRYWNDILDLIYEQQISSYLMKHFRFH